MSENKDTDAKIKPDTNTEIKKLRNYIIILVIIITGLVVAFGLTLLRVNQIENGGLNSLDANYMSNEDFIKSGTTIDYIDMTNDERTETLEFLDTQVNNLSKSNIYLQINEDLEGETFTTLIFNKSGECISEDNSGGISIYKNDGNAVMFGDQIVYTQNIEAVGTMKAALNTVKTGHGTLTRCLPTLDEEKTDYMKYEEFPSEYLVDIEGWDNIRALYNYFGEDFGAAMVESLKDGFKQSASDNGMSEEDVETPNFRYAFIVNTDNELEAVGCYIYFGENANGYWGNTSIMWYCDYMVDIGDWELGTSWYDYDYSTMQDDKGETLQNMLNELYDRVVPMLEKLNTSADNSTSGGLIDSNSLDDGEIPEGAVVISPETFLGEKPADSE